MTDALPPEIESVAAGFARQAARHPDRLAVRGERHAFTYEALDRFTNRLAHALLADAPGAIAVGLLVEHDALVTAVQLATAKARRLYVPLEPDHPPARHEAILAEAGTSVVLADRAHRDAARALAARIGGRVLDVEGVGDRPGAPVGPPPRGDERAFVVFTSGSTGRPKGVCQIHRTVAHAAWVRVVAHDIGVDDRSNVVLTATSITSNTGVNVALLSGGAALYFDVRRHGPAALAAWTEREGITVHQSTPTLFRRMMEAAPPHHRFAALRFVRLAGEATTRTEWELWRAHAPADGVFETGLGSTEAYSICRWVGTPATRVDGGVLPVGRPIPGKEVLLLDDDGRPVADGEPGEIVVRSEYLFDGYWRRPELTARALRPDPADPRRRVFWTGDVGRRRPDGDYEHLGRKDRQVKVNGHRVEAAEVEHALRALDGVSDAAVVAHELAPGRARLVAFLAGGATPPPDRRTLRARLRGTLPAHMVPSDFVGLDALPTLAGGKIDRTTLATRAADAHARGSGHTPPRTPVEETLASLVQQVLGVPRVGVDDDLLLDLGADSLAIVQLLDAAAAVFGREIPLGVLADEATVARLATHVLADGWTSADHVVRRGEGSRPPLFAVCGAFGHALRLLTIAQRLDDEQPFHALQPPAMDWATVGAATIEAMAAHYVETILRARPHGPYQLLGTSLGGVLVFEVACRLRARGGAVPLLAMVDTMPPHCARAGGVDRAVFGDWAAGAPSPDRLVAQGQRVARQHRAALDAYVLRRHFDGTLLYFRCLDPPVELAADRRLLWAEYVDALRVVDVPGLHGRFHEEPQLSAVADGLRAALAR